MMTFVKAVPAPAYRRERWNRRPTFGSRTAEETRCCPPRRGLAALFRLLCRGIDDAEIPGVGPAGDHDALRGQTSLQELSHGGSPARHSPCETPIVQRRQFVVSQHDLQPFASR